MPATTKKTAPHASTHAANARASASASKKEQAMTKKTHAHPTTKIAHTHTHAKETAAMSSSIEEASVSPSAHAVVTAVASPAASATSAAPLPAVASPPADANIPVPPRGFSPASPGEFRNEAPRKSELAAMSQALIDLSNFTNFDALFVGIGLTQASVTQAILVGSQWSALRAATALWDKYCVLQEGYSWRAIRATLLPLRQAFELAGQTNPQLVTNYPGLASLLGAKKTIAQKGASTRRLNQEAKAKGEPQNHGAVGKKRQRAAANAALAKAEAGAAGASTPVTETPVSAAAPPTPTAAVVPVGIPAAAPVNGIGH